MLALSSACCLFLHTAELIAGAATITGGLVVFLASDPASLAAVGVAVFLGFALFTGSTRVAAARGTLSMLLGILVFVDSLSVVDAMKKKGPAPKLLGVAAASLVTAAIAGMSVRLAGGKRRAENSVDQRGGPKGARVSGPGALHPPAFPDGSAAPVEITTPSGFGSSADGMDDVEDSFPSVSASGSLLPTALTGLGVLGRSNPVPEPPMRR